MSIRGILQEEKKMMDKNCGSDVPCSYRLFSNLFYGCSYEGYCDFQRPLDSRIYNLPNVELSTCVCAGQEGNDGKCLVCKRPKKANP